MTKNRAVDLSYLNKMAMGDVRIIRETVESFLQSTPEALANLQEYLEQQKWDKLAKEAHKIKPNLIYMGMSEAHEILLKIEQQAKGGNTEGIEKRIHTFSVICNQALDELLQKVNEMKP